MSSEDEDVLHKYRKYDPPPQELPVYSSDEDSSGSSILTANAEPLTAKADLLKVLDYIIIVGNRNRYQSLQATREQISETTTGSNELSEIEQTDDFELSGMHADDFQLDPQRRKKSRLSAALLCPSYAAWEETNRTDALDCTWCHQYSDCIALPYNKVRSKEPPALKGFFYTRTDRDLTLRCWRKAVHAASTVMVLEGVNGNVRLDLTSANSAEKDAKETCLNLGIALSNLKPYTCPSCFKVFQSCRARECHFWGENNHRGCCWSLVHKKRHSILKEATNKESTICQHVLMRLILRSIHQKCHQLPKILDRKFIVCLLGAARLHHLRLRQTSSKLSQYPGSASLDEHSPDLP